MDKEVVMPAHIHTHTHTHTHVLRSYSAIRKKEILTFVITWIDLEFIMLR